MLLSLKWFQVAALKGGESMQQGTFSKHNFYEWVKKMNQVDRKLKWIKKKCVKWSEGWHNTVSKKAVIQDSILYKDHHLWVFKNMITEFFWLTYDEPFSDHQGQNQTKS